MDEAKATQSYADAMSVLDELDAPSVTAPPAPVSAPAPAAYDDPYGHDDDDDDVAVPDRDLSWPEQTAPTARAEPQPEGIVVPPTVDATRIALGVLVIALGAFLLAFYLPSRRPWRTVYDSNGDVLSTDRPKNTYEWRFTPERYDMARGIAAGVIVFGALVAGLGLRFRDRLEVKCKRCRRYRLAARNGLWLDCPSGRHKAGISLQTLALMVTFVALAFALFVTIAMASITRGSEPSSSATKVTELRSDSC